MKIKNRRFLKKKEIKKLKEEIKDNEIKKILEKGEKFEIVPVEKDFAVIFVDDLPILIISENNKIIPHLAALIYKKLNVEYPFVKVDQGAVKHILNGADVMRPGITDFSEEIHKDDVVIVLEPSKGLPIAVGIALFNSEEIKSMKKGKVIKTIHYYKDNFWNLGIKGLRTKFWISAFMRHKLSNY